MKEGVHVNVTDRGYTSDEINVTLTDPIWGGSEEIEYRGEGLIAIITDLLKSGLEIAEITLDRRAAEWPTGIHKLQDKFPGIAFQRIAGS